MSKLGYVLRILRVPLLLALLLLSSPVFERHLSALQRVEMDRLQSTWTALVTIAVVFLIAAVIGRQQRQPLWLLVVEALLAGLIGLIGLIVPAWGMWLGGMGPDGLALPGALQLLVEAFGDPRFVAGPLQGMGVALNWFVLVLALAWLVVVAESAIRQIRQTRASRHRQPQPVR